MKPDATYQHRSRLLMIQCSQQMYSQKCMKCTAEMNRKHILEGKLSKNELTCMIIVIIKYQQCNFQLMVLVSFPFLSCLLKKEVASHDKVSITNSHFSLSANLIHESSNKDVISYAEQRHRH